MTTTLSPGVIQKLTPQELNRFVGTYEAGGRTFGIENRDGLLYRTAEGAAPVQLKPESMTKLFYTDGTDRQVELVLTHDAVQQAAFIDNGVKIALIRRD